jgi:hypothetical protein
MYAALVTLGVVTLCMQKLLTQWVQGLNFHNCRGIECDANLAFWRTHVVTGIVCSFACLRCWVDWF